MNPTPEQVDAGQAVYSKRTLSVYDILVLGISNRCIWKCPTPRIESHYNKHLSNNHLDVGVGTGYFLDRCKFPTPSPRIALMDLNPNTLEVASKRISRYNPETYVQNVLEPLKEEIAGFDSVGINYLLHCLPGTISEKTILFDHLKPAMNSNAKIFGSTILQGGVPRSWTAKRLMNFYNKKGIFSNTHDDLDGLAQSLNNHFTEVQIEVIGCVALFSATKT